MGVVGRQSFWNFLFTYAGILLGAINFIILFPLFFSVEQLGLIRLLQSLGLITSQVTQLGTHAGILRFYPNHKTKPVRLIREVYKLCLKGTLLFLIVYFFAKPLIISLYVERSPLYVDYYYYLIPITLSMMGFAIWESIAIARLQTTPPLILREVVSRLLLLLTLGLYALQWISFPVFMTAWLVQQVGLMFLIPLWLGRTPYFTIKTEETFSPAERKAFIHYSLYAALSGGTTLLVFNIDSIMLGAMVGLSAVGVYSIYLNLATLLAIPNRVFARVMSPLLAQAWNDNRTDLVRKYYQQSALIPVLIAIWIFVGIHINRELLFQFLRRPEYRENYPMFIYLSIAFIINTAFGLNNNVLVSSPLYRFETYFNLFTVFITALANYILIRWLGAVGAAVATLLTLLILNILKALFIQSRFGVMPFTRNYFMAFLSIIPALCTANYLPDAGNIWINLIYRSGLFSLLFFLPMYWFHIIPELNATIFAGKQHFARVVKKLNNSKK